MGLFGLTADAKTTNTLDQSSLSSCAATTTTSNVVVSKARAEAVSKGDISVKAYIPKWGCPAGITPQGGGQMNLGNINQQLVQHIVAAVDSASNQSCSATMSQSAEQEATSTAKGFAFSGAESNNDISSSVTNSAVMKTETIQRLNNQMNLLAVVDRKIELEVNLCIPVVYNMGNIVQDAEQYVAAALKSENAAVSTMASTQDSSQVSSAETVDLLIGLTDSIFGGLTGLLAVVGVVPLIICIVLILLVFKMRGSLFAMVTGGSDTNKKAKCNSERATRMIVILVVVLLVVSYSLWPSSAFVPIFRPDAEASAIAFVGCLVFWSICIAISLQVPCLWKKEENPNENIFERGKRALRSMR